MVAGNSRRVCFTASSVNCSGSTDSSGFQTLDIARLAQRIVNRRSIARDEFEVHAHRLENRQQVREQNRRVHAQLVHRRDHDLAAQVRALAQLQKIEPVPH